MLQKNICKVFDIYSGSCVSPLSPLAQKLKALNFAGGVHMFLSNLYGRALSHHFAFLAAMYEQNCHFFRKQMLKFGGFVSEEFTFNSEVLDTKFRLSALENKRAIQFVVWS